MGLLLPPEAVSPAPGETANQTIAEMAASARNCKPAYHVEEKAEAGDSTRVADGA